MPRAPRKEEQLSRATRSWRVHVNPAPKLIEISGLRPTAIAGDVGVGDVGVGVGGGLVGLGERLAGDAGEQLVAGLASVVKQTGGWDTASVGVLSARSITVHDATRLSVQNHASAAGAHS